MPPLISVITPVYQPNRAYLKQAYESLCAQDVSWEWVLQLDGRERKLRNWHLPQWLDQDSRVAFERNGAHLGIAMTRNRALMRARGELIQTLDADDYLLPGALAALSQTLLKEPSLAYAAGYIAIEELDGTLRNDRWYQPFGEIAPGEIEKFWRRENGSVPFHPATAMWRRTVLFAYGGWPAIQVCEDTTLLLVISATHTGKLIDCNTVYYRKHGKSICHQPEYLETQAPRDGTFTAARMKAMSTLAAGSGRARQNSGRSA